MKLFFFLFIMFSQLYVKALTIGILDGDKAHGAMVRYIIKEYSKKETKIETCFIPEKFNSKLYLDCLSKLAETSDVINISISGLQYSVEEEKIIKDWANKGKIFVTSVGNDNLNQLKYPASYSYGNNNIISVMYHDNFKKGKHSNYPADISALGIFALQDTVFEGCSVAVAFVSAILSYYDITDFKKLDFIRINTKKSLYHNVSDYLYYNGRKNNVL